MMHPTAIQTLRKYTHGGNSYALVEVGEEGEGPAVNLMGWPVIANRYLDAPAVGASPIYLANWPRFMWIVDHSEMTLQRMEQEDAAVKKQAELQRIQAEWQRKVDHKERVELAVTIVAVVLAVGYLAALMWAIRLHRENQLPLPWAL